MSPTRQVDVAATAVVAVIILSALTAGQDLPPGFTPTVFLRYRTWELQRACPKSGPASCDCIHDPDQPTEGPFDVDEDPIGSIITFIACNPGYCNCTDPAEGVEVDVRSEAVAAVLNACPRGKINRCLCEDKKTVLKYPFNIVQLAECRPTRCKCDGAKKKEVSFVNSMGCKRGGLADCPTKGEFYCSNGDHVSPDYMMLHMMKGRTDCLCSDGIMPRCKETGEFPRCPGGEELDHNLGRMPEFGDCKLTA